VSLQAQGLDADFLLYDGEHEDAVDVHVAAQDWVRVALQEVSEFGDEERGGKGLDVGGDWVELGTWVFLQAMVQEDVSIAKSQEAVRTLKRPLLQMRGLQVSLQVEIRGKGLAALWMRTHRLHI